MLVEETDGMNMLESTSQKTSHICRWMCQLILLIVALLKRDEDAEIVCSSNHPNASTGELCTDLVESASFDTLLGTVDVEG